nr:protein E33A [Elephantid betaherpesvirus 1]
MCKKPVRVSNTRVVSAFVDRSCTYTWLIILMAYVFTLIVIDLCWFMYCIIAFGLFSRNPEFTFTEYPFTDFYTNCTLDQ